MRTKAARLRDRSGRLWKYIYFCIKYVAGGSLCGEDGVAALSLCMRVPFVVIVSRGSCTVETRFGSRVGGPVWFRVGQIARRDWMLAMHRVCVPRELRVFFVWLGGHFGVVGRCAEAQLRARKLFDAIGSARKYRRLINTVTIVIIDTIHFPIHSPDISCSCGCVVVAFVTVCLGWVAFLVFS